jgi:predicted PurR-regulated permease PerM
MDWERARHTFQTALIWVVVAALAFVLWQIRAALLLLFGAVIVAILLRVLGSLIARWTRISEQLGLGIATAMVLGIIGVTVWLFGSQTTNQFTQLLQNVETGEQSLKAMFNGSGFATLGAHITAQGASFITSSISNALSSGLRFLEAAVILAITAVYLAAQPQLYRRGIGKLFHHKFRSRALHSIDLIGRTLKLWLLGQLILMVGVGVLSFVAVWVIGLPNPGALALIAGMAEIVPYLGPFISAIPAILVALTQGLQPALWTIAAYLAIHIVEGYVTAPLIQRHFVTIPPAVILTGIVAVDLLFGTVGIILAAPITVAVYMAIKMVYVDNPLDEPKSKEPEAPARRRA